MWSAWTPAGSAKRGLRRELTGAERQMLEQRRDELAPFLAPYHESEIGEIAATVAAMFSSFRSMRQSGQEAMAMVESVLRAAHSYPAWAIVKACQSIQTDGIWRDMAFDRRWAPNDSEIINQVRKETRLYADSYNSAVALLAAVAE